MPLADRRRETRFTELYGLLMAYPGLVALRGARPRLGLYLLARLVEPQLADGLGAGMSAGEMITVYRRMYLLILGCMSFVDHRDPGAPGGRPLGAGRPRPRGSSSR